MANNSANVVAPKPQAAGGIYVGALATALPTDSTTALAVAFKSAGYVDSGGVTETIKRTTKSITAWGGDTVKVVQTGYEVDYQFKLIESLSSVAAGIAYGDGNVVAGAATATVGNTLAIKLASTPLGHKVYVIDMLDGDATVRIVIPDGQVTDTKGTTYDDSGAASYDVTITSYPDANGVNAYKYTDDGVLVPA